MLVVFVMLPAFGLDTVALEREAQLHCPKDTVVWLNLPTMIWHYKASGGTPIQNTVHSRARRRPPRAAHARH
jgi:hypothetical protein